MQKVLQSKPPAGNVMPENSVVCDAAVGHTGRSNTKSKRGESNKTVNRASHPIHALSTWRIFEIKA